MVSKRECNNYDDFKRWVKIYRYHRKNRKFSNKDDELFFEQVDRSCDKRIDVMCGGDDLDEDNIQCNKIVSEYLARIDKEVNSNKDSNKESSNKYSKKVIFIVCILILFIFFILRFPK